MRFPIILIIGMLFVFSSVEAQNYTRAVGFRSGYSSGIVYRNYKQDFLAYETLLSFRQKGMKLTFLVEQYRPAHFEFANEHMWILFGFGGHAGWHVTDQYEIFFTRYKYDDNMIAPLLGLDGVIGMEYHIPDFPLVLGVDYKPFFEFSTRQYFNLNLTDVAFFVKYKF